MSEAYIQSSFTKEDLNFENPLRPSGLEEFYGQKNLQERLHIFMGAAKQRNEPLGHSLFSGPPGLGKTTLAHIIAKNMNSHLVITSGPALEKASDLAGILTNLKKGDILFIDEIHRLPRVIEEYLYPAMENFCLDLMIDSGPNARSVQISLNPFTLIAATTRSGLLSSPLLSRFAFHGRLDYYDTEILSKIILRSAGILQMQIQHEALVHIAKRARGTPRIANNLLRWVRDYAQMQKTNHISHQIAQKALEMLSIDEKGLDEMDKKMLKTLIEQFEGGPVGIKTLSVAVGEEEETLSEVHEPYLIMNGFLKRTPRGREATLLAYQHLGYKNPKKNSGD